MRFLIVIAIATSACSRPQPAPGQGVAAVAYRDAVPAWQRLGTRGFSKHYLEKAYDHVAYLEADALGAGAHAALRQAVIDAAANERAVDVYILVNSGREVDALAELPPATRSKLRLVYDTGVLGLSQAPAWRALGVRAYVAHPGAANLAPFFYVDFLRALADGATAQQAVAEANASLHERLHGTTAWLALRASGFPAEPRDLDYWEAATRAELVGEGAFAVR